jgi:hypothetical protein
MVLTRNPKLASQERAAALAGGQYVVDGVTIGYPKRHALLEGTRRDRVEGVPRVAMCVCFLMICLLVF